MELVDVHLRLVADLQSLMNDIFILRLLAAKGLRADTGASVKLLEHTLGILPGHNEQPPEDAPFTANR